MLDQYLGQRKQHRCDFAKTLEYHLRFIRTSCVWHMQLQHKQLRFCRDKKISNMLHRNPYGRHSSCEWAFSEFPTFTVKDVSLNGVKGRLKNRYSLFKKASLVNTIGCALITHKGVYETRDMGSSYTRFGNIWSNCKSIESMLVGWTL